MSEFCKDLAYSKYCLVKKFCCCCELYRGVAFTGCLMSVLTPLAIISFGLFMGGGYPMPFGEASMRIGQCTGGIIFLIGFYGSYCWHRKWGSWLMYYTLFTFTCLTILFYVCVGLFGAHLVPTMKADIIRVAGKEDLDWNFGVSCIV